MDQVNAEPQMEMYPSRLYALCLAIPSAGIATGLAWVYVHQSAQSGGLSVGDTILLVCGCIVFGVIALFAFYWLLTPTPLLEFDSSGFRYHQIYLNGVVRWADLETIFIRHEVVKIRGIRNVSVDIHLSYRSDAPLSSGRKPTQYISVARRLLPIRPEQVADTFRHFFHDVTYVDEHGVESRSGGG